MLEIEEDWFTKRFLAQVPIDKIRTIAQQLRKRYGDVLAIDGSGTSYVVTTESHSIPVFIQLDAGGAEGGCVGEHRRVALRDLVSAQVGVELAQVEHPIWGHRGQAIIDSLVANHWERGVS